MIFLSTPSARRATRLPILALSRFPYFYPRPPRGGRRLARFDEQNGNFISIHALREEGDHHGSHLCNPHCISIHALREEGDVTPSLRTSSAAYFYPRPPRGGRRNLRRRYSSAAAISIHALREEGDPL